MFPMLGGLVLGSFFGLTKPTLRKDIALPLVTALAFLGTLISGEAHWDWSAPLIALSACSGFLAVRQLVLLKR